MEFCFGHIVWTEIEVLEELGDLSVKYVMIKGGRGQCETYETNHYLVLFQEMA
jgi:hypothetical protein